MGEIEKKSSGKWTQFMVETLNKMEQPIAHVIIPVVLVVIIFIFDWRVGLSNLATLPLGLLFSCLMKGGDESRA